MGEDTDLKNPHKTNRQKTITRAAVQKEKIYEPKLEIKGFTLTGEYNKCKKNE